MLLEVLKALGLDVPAQINALKSDIDQRVQSATSQVSQVAQQAAMLAFLYAFAAGAALLAIGVALFALFWWVSDYYGVYAGLGVVFLLLVLAALIPAMMALGRSRSFAVDAGKSERSSWPARGGRPVLSRGREPRARGAAGAAKPAGGVQTPRRATSSSRSSRC